MDPKQVSLPQSKQPFITNQQSQSEQKEPQFAFGSQIERNSEHDNAATNHLKEAEAAKNLRVRNGYIEAAIRKEQQHEAEPGGPKPTRFAAARDQKRANQQTDSENIEERNLKTA